MNIITKFLIATEEGTDIIMKLSRDLANEKFSTILDQNTLEEYIDSNFNKKQLISDLNNLSNQWLVVYFENEPVGYAKITSKGQKPKILEDKRAVRIADLAILAKYSQIEIKNALLQKCLLVSKSYDGVWINEFTTNPLLDYFERNEFIKQTEVYQHDELKLPSTCFIYSTKKTEY